MCRFGQGQISQLLGEWRILLDKATARVIIGAVMVWPIGAVAGRGGVSDSGSSVESAHPADAPVVRLPAALAVAMPPNRIAGV